MGLETIEALGRPAVVLGPNTAIQSQWVSQARDLGMTVSETRELSQVTVLTYQSIAVFLPGDDSDSVDDDVQHRGRLHPNAAAFVEELSTAGPLTFILDECHHLLQVWGELLIEVIEGLADVRVLALSATPPQSMSQEESGIVARLFGPIVYSATIPAFVRDGHLAPFRELVAFTSPTREEANYLGQTSERFRQIQVDLMRPGATAVPFLEWLDRRFVSRADVAERRTADWSALVKEQPALGDAVLRAHAAGLLDQPQGSTVRERHRAPLTADDWALLLDDFVSGSLIESDHDDDRRTLEALRHALPGIGYRLTKRGIVRGTTPVDRVVARSASKALAAVDIAEREWHERGDRLRMLVICDFERASATVPAGLEGVLDAQEGSARGVLDRMIAQGGVAHLNPVMVSGSRVCCGSSVAPTLVAWLRAHGGGLDLDDPELTDLDSGDAVEITGRWNSRVWVPLLTRWFEEGQGRVLIGTRALLGEGWDCRPINVLADLSSATTSLAVTQIRGRALRMDPGDAQKVAHNWSVVCLAPDHPLGNRDYERFARKHRGFFAVTSDGTIVDGIAHVHPDLSEYGPPTSPAEVTRAMHAVAADRDASRQLWRVGEPYFDTSLHEIRVRIPRSLGLDLGAVGALSARSARGAQAGTVSGRVRLRPHWWRSLIAVIQGGDGVDPDSQRREVTESFAAAVADALHSVGDTPVDSSAVRLSVNADGVYRVWLETVDELASEIFASALDEVLLPLATPRYVVPRFVIPVPTSRRERRRLAWRQLWRRPVTARVVWHAVPTSLATHRSRADEFAAAWNRWISPGKAVFAGSPEGAGILAAQRGDDPFDITTAMRTDWR